MLDRAPPENHGVVVDHRNTVEFCTLAREMGTTAAALAHRYALNMAGDDTVVLGCKNRAELIESIDTVDAGPLAADVIRRIDDACAGPIS